MLSPILQKVHTSPIEALKTVVEFVKTLNENTVFLMNDYYNCVIGVLNDNDNWSDSEETILKSFFGIDIGKYDWNISYFGSSSTATHIKAFAYTGIDLKVYTGIDLKVIELFTDSIGRAVSVEYWLELANLVLEGN